MANSLHPSWRVAWSISVTHLGVAVSPRETVT